MVHPAASETGCQPVEQSVVGGLAGRHDSVCTGAWPPHTFSMTVRVFGPTMPRPVEFASPPDTTPLDSCHAATAACVIVPK